MGDEIRAGRGGREKSTWDGGGPNARMIIAQLLFLVRL